MTLPRASLPMISFESRGRQTLETFASRNARTGQRSAAEVGKTAEAADFIAQFLFVAWSYCFLFLWLGCDGLNQPLRRFRSGKPYQL